MADTIPSGQAGTGTYRIIREETIRCKGAVIARVKTQRYIDQDNKVQYRTILRFSFPTDGLFPSPGDWSPGSPPKWVNFSIWRPDPADWKRILQAIRDSEKLIKKCQEIENIRELESIIEEHDNELTEIETDLQDLT